MDAMSVGTVEASCHRLRPLVDPASIAIFGASADPKRLGGVPVSLLRQHKFAGAIYPINPKYQEIDGLTCYPDIAALPGPVVWGEGVYCVPRHGRLLVGATVEEAGFDTSLTARGRDRLRRAAESLMPALKGWDLADHWAGLRPKAPDGLPVLGATATPNLFVAGGQFRNGILFTPAIAQKMADLLLGRGRVDPAFDPQRFSGQKT